MRKLPFIRAAVSAVALFGALCYGVLAAGSVWPTTVDTLSLQAVNDPDTAVAAKQLESYLQPNFTAQTPAYAATLKLDPTKGEMITVGALTGNITFSPPTAGLSVGRRMVVIVKQDATGSRSITWDAPFTFTGGPPIPLTFGATPTSVAAASTGTQAYASIAEVGASDVCIAAQQLTPVAGIADVNCQVTSANTITIQRANVQAAGTVIPGSMVSAVIQKQAGQPSQAANAVSGFVFIYDGANWQCIAQSYGIVPGPTPTP